MNVSFVMLFMWIDYIKFFIYFLMIEVTCLLQIHFFQRLTCKSKNLLKPQKKQYKIREVWKVERDLYGSGHNMPTSHKCR